jgi:hypothetical protein
MRSYVTAFGYPDAGNTVNFQPTNIDNRGIEVGIHRARRADYIQLVNFVQHMSFVDSDLGQTPFTLYYVSADQGYLASTGWTSDGVRALIALTCQWFDLSKHPKN